MWMNVAQKIERATRWLADDACDMDDDDLDEPFFTMTSMGLTGPRDLIEMGTTCLEAIDGLLPYPPQRISLTPQFTDFFFQQSPLFSRLRSMNQTAMSGGTSLFSPLIYSPPDPLPHVVHYLDMPVIVDPAPEPGTMLFLNTRHLFGRDFDPRYHAIIKNVKTDASDPSS